MHAGPAGALPGVDCASALGGALELRAALHRAGFDPVRRTRPSSAAVKTPAIIVIGHSPALSVVPRRASEVLTTILIAIVLEVAMGDAGLL